MKRLGVATLYYILDQVERILSIKRFVERLERSMTNFIHFESGCDTAQFLPLFT